MVRTASPHALTAVVVGAGWAAEGHVRALQQCGVQVAALCGRQPHVVRATADRLGVAGASTDWRATLQEVRPDVVTVATPATVRSEVVRVAVPLRSHVLCEKPLAATASEAATMYRLVAQAGVKHCYGATHVYDPSVRWLAELVQGGAIGTLREIDGTFRAPRNARRLRPWTWSDSLAAGGGPLNLGFTHTLAVLQTITGLAPVRVTGQARRNRATAPVVDALHDSRDVRRGVVRVPTAEEAAHLEWRERDVEDTYAALIAFGDPATPGGADHEVLVNVSSGHGAPAWPANGWRFFGDAGTLVAEGRFEYQVSRVGSSGALEPLPVPDRLEAALPRAEGDDGEHLNQSKWNALLRDFIADVRGEPHGAYPTFADGWRIQEVIDAIRGGRGWHVIEPAADPAQRLAAPGETA